ncbi:hypothetical protein [uncultured Endozoicomonas sp.]|nr:hypothetical protein [uncultured Endozoicomonas sp.]
MTGAHMNDSFFWVIAEFSGMDTMTAATLLQGVSVLITVQILGWWLL